MSHIREVTIVSGNILNKTVNLQKGTSNASAEELYETLKSCLESRKDLGTGTRNGNAIEVRNGEDVPVSGGGEERSDVKVSLKLFLYSTDPKHINEAISRGLSQCSVDYLDTLVFSLPPSSEDPTFDTIQNLWKVLEENVDKRVKMIGICDLETKLFMKLHKWATIKPSIVQINLSSCCVVPPELSEFCKENEVQLLTHSDPMDILESEKLQELIKPMEAQLRKEDENVNELKVEAKWIIRYQIHLKTRGVLASKGYAASLVLL